MKNNNPKLRLSDGAKFVLPSNVQAVLVAAMRVRELIPDTSNYTPTCVRELKDAVDAATPLVFKERE